MSRSRPSSLGRVPWGGGKAVCVGGGGVGEGAQTSEPLYKDSPLARKLGRQAAQTENVLKILFPIDTYLKVHHAFSGLL